MKTRRKGKVREPPEQTEWMNLVRLDAVDAFSRWLGSPFQGWHLLPPQEGELLHAEKNGRTIAVRWAAQHTATACSRAVMVLWYAFLFEASNNNNFETCNK